MRKNYCYGVEEREGKSYLHRFPYLQDLDLWIRIKPFLSNTGYGRYQTFAKNGEVRRVLRRMVKEPELTFPVEI